MAIPLLVLIDVADPDIKPKLVAGGFEPTFATAAAARAETIETRGSDFKAVLTHGSAGLRGDEIAKLPNIEIISAFGAGHENIDHAAARARGIVVTHGPGTNDGTVADHAMALLLAIVRTIVQGDACVHRGDWAKSRVVCPTVTSKRLGILGLGTIGQQIARRGAGGFDMAVGYHNRRPKPDTAYPYFPTVRELAQWCDFLVIATPGGAATKALVNADVLEALGPSGFLVNIARGSVVDTDALIASLAAGGIAGAALDVVDGEPHVPAALLELPNVILTPHTAGRSPESVEAMISLVLQNMTAHFAGRPVLTPVKA